MRTCHDLYGHPVNLATRPLFFFVARISSLYLPLLLGPCVPAGWFVKFELLQPSGRIRRKGKIPALAWPHITSTTDPRPGLLCKTIVSGNGGRQQLCAESGGAAIATAAVVAPLSQKCEGF